MEFSKYGGGTAKLMEKISATVYDPNSHVFSRLKKLETIAKGAESNELLGFVYYNYALAYYSRGKSKELLHYIKQAISYLVGQDDKNILASAYNVFAVEAKTNGCFEVALDYYLTAHTLMEDEKDSMSYAPTGANIADLLAQMGEYKKAYQYAKYIKQAIKLFEKKKHAVNPVNIALSYVNLGLIALNSNKYEEALKAEAVLEEIGASTIREYGEVIELYYLIFKVRLAIAANEHEKIDSLVQELVRDLSRGSILSELIQEILDIFDKLLEIGDFKNANHLLNTLENKTQMNNYARLLFAQLKIKYYDAVGDRDRCMECYEERLRYLHKHLEVQNFIYYESITLMEMLEDLRREEEKIRFDNIAIQKNAETDSLTGIPNRYALDRHLDYYFSEAKKNQVCLGTGIVDIDCFKQYNDNYGHIQGDRCLIDVAKTLEEIAKKHDLFVARYGGDEFVLIYYDHTNKEIASIESNILNATSVSVTHGFYNAVPDIESKIYDYLSKADQELYKNKKKSGVYDTWT